MLRFCKVLRSRFRESSFRDFVGMVWTSLFRNDPILIYSLYLPGINVRERDERGGVEVRKGKVEDLGEASRLREPVPWEFQCHLYDGVKEFFVARDADGIQHISWIYYQRDPNRLLRLNPSEAEIKYCLTLNRFRGQGLYSRVLRSIAGYLREIGLRRVFICVREDNQPSIRGIEKADFKRIGRTRLLKIAGIQISKKLVFEEV